MFNMFLFPEVKNGYLYTEVQFLYEHIPRPNDMVAAMVAQLLVEERYLN
jgi:hypothetical protein